MPTDPVSRDSRATMIGKSLNHYKILRDLGSGGMADVYAAEDTKLRSAE